MGGGSRKLREVPGNRGELSEGATSPMEGTEFAPWKQEKKTAREWCEWLINENVPIVGFTPFGRLSLHGKKNDRQEGENIC